MDAEFTKISAQFKQHQQEQVLQYYSSLNDQQKGALLQQLRQIDPQRVNAIFKKATEEAKKREQGERMHDSGEEIVGKPVMEPLPAECFASMETAPEASIAQWKAAGMEAIANGKVGVVLLAGGQGTRLGSSAPKGCYDIGLPSKKSLFQLQGERILRLQQLAKLKAGKTVVIPWYVMTSGPTRADTEAFFVKQNYFGLSKENVIFFEQGVLPAFTMDGKVILEDKEKVSVAPDGNGGVYAGLRSSGVLEDMQKRGLEYLHAYCVDNCLVRVGDPTFLGYCISKNAKCGAKVVRKMDPTEPVGVVCRVNGKYGVVEYSEISKEDSEKKTANGHLAFDAANIANHFYKLSFLQKVCSREFEEKLDYHIAYKKIKCIDPATQTIVAPSKPNGIKLELFIFDIFPFLEKNEFAVFSVPRSDEFSPLKNAPGAGVDCPETSRRDLFSQSVRFLEAAGVKVTGVSGTKGVEKVKEGDKEVPALELSPLVSYEGEGLESVKGKSIKVDQPIYIGTSTDLAKFQ